MGYGFYDITLYYSSSKYYGADFDARTNLVSELYVQYLNKYKPKGTTRISITFADEEWIVGYGGSSILSVYATFDENAYRANPDNKNLFILDTIHRIALMCADKYAWDKQPFETAYQKVIECNFVYRIEQKRKFSKDRKHQACLLFENNGQSTIISVAFYNKNGEYLKTAELFRSWPDKWFYEGITRNSKWFNDRRFGVYGKNEELIIQASLEDLNSEIIIKPNTNTVEELESYLKRVIYTKINDESDYIDWVNT